jgi:hypothetical protein
MQTMFYGLMTCYCLMMPLLFANWYGMHAQDGDMSRTERRWSGVVLALATLLWPVVLPLTYIELLGKVKRYERLERMNRSYHTASEF